MGGGEPVIAESLQPAVGELADHPFSRQAAANGRENAKLTPRQEAAALCFARGGSLGDASRESKAGQRTITEWMASLPAFTRRIRELRAAMTERALGVLVDGMTDAAMVLRDLV